MSASKKLSNLTGIVGQFLFISMILYFSYDYKILITFQNILQSSLLLILVELLISSILLLSGLLLANKEFGGLIHVWSLSLGASFLNIHVVFLGGLMGIPLILLAFPFFISLVTTSFSIFRFTSSGEGGQTSVSQPAEEEGATFEPEEETLSEEGEPIEREESREEDVESDQEPQEVVVERESRDTPEEEISREEIRQIIDTSKFENATQQYQDAEETLRTLKFSLREIAEQEKTIRKRLAEEIETSLDNLFEARGIKRLSVENAARALGFSADQFASFENIVEYLATGELSNYKLRGGAIEKT